jgi:hypothetical protein
MLIATFWLLKLVHQSHFNASRVTTERPCELTERKFLTCSLPGKIVQQLSRLPEQRRAQFYKNFPQDYQCKLLGTLIRGELSSGSAFFPLVIQNTFLSDAQSKLLVAVVPVPEHMYNHRQLAMPPEQQSFFHLAIVANRREYIDDICPRRVLGYRQRLCASAVRAASAVHIRCRVVFSDQRQALHGCFLCIDALNPGSACLADGRFENANDLKQCWICALERSCTQDFDEKEWRNLPETSTSSGVIPLDDIFPLMPDAMPIDAFQPTTLRSLTEYKRKAEDSANRICILTKRSNDQHTLIHNGSILVVELDPMPTCWICNMPV